MLNLNDIECVDNRQFDESDINSLAASIGNVGLLQPLVLAKNESGTLRVIAGRRRYRALMKLQRYELVEADYRILEDCDQELVSFVENFERVPLTIHEEVAQIAALRERYSPAEIGTLLGKSESFVRRRMQLQTLIPELQKAMASDSIPNWRPNHYIAVSRYPADVQKRILTGWGYTDFKGTLKDFCARLECNFSLLLSSAPFDRSECNSCFNRSGAEALLFDEFRPAKNNDRCLDCACFERKRNAAIVDTVKELKASPKPVTLITAAPEDSLPKELQKSTHLQAKNVDILARDVPPEHANAFVIGGDGAGTYCRIADKKEGADAPVPAGKTLEDRRAELDKRRLKRAQLLLSEDLLKSKPKKPILPVPDDVRLLRWIAALGCEHVSGVGYQYGIAGTDYAMKLETDIVRAGIWVNILIDIGNCLRNAAEMPLDNFRPDDGTRAAKLLGLSWEDYVLRATELIPEPKCWTKE